MEFHNDIQWSPLYDFDSTIPVNSYIELFNSEVQRIVNKHAPLKSRTRQVGRDDRRWLLMNAHDAKRCCHRREQCCHRTKSTFDRMAFHAARDAIKQSRSDAIRQYFSQCYPSPNLGPFSVLAMFQCSFFDPVFFKFFSRPFATVPRALT